MKTTVTTEIQFLHTITRGELIRALEDVPDNATITVSVDTPRNPTPLDPGGTVTIRATWKEK